MSADEELGLVYLPFGTPTNDFYGGHRPGDNLFAESLVAIEARSGQARVALPDGASRHLGLRPARRADPRRSPRRTGAQSRPSCRSASRGSPTCSIARPARRSGRSRSGPCRSRRLPGERTSPTQPFPLRPPPFERQGLTDEDLDRLHAGAAGAGPGPSSRRSTAGRSSRRRRSAARSRCPDGWAARTGAARPSTPRPASCSCRRSRCPSVLQLMKPDPEASNFLFRRGGVTLLPLIDGLPVVKPPYSRVTAIDLNRGELRWTTPARRRPACPSADRAPEPPAAGVGRPRRAARDAHAAVRGDGPGRTRQSARNVAVGDQPLSPPLPPEAPRLVAFDKATGAQRLGRHALGPAGRVADDLSARGRAVPRRGYRRRPVGGARRLRARKMMPALRGRVPCAS